MALSPITLGADLPVLDQSRLLDQFGDEPAIIAELRDLFLEDFPQQLQKIRDGIAAGDCDLVARAAHSLKGASGTFGAERVYQVSQAVESFARNGQLDSVAMGVDLLGEELEKVVARIRDLQLA